MSVVWLLRRDEKRNRAGNAHAAVPYSAEGPGERVLRRAERRYAWQATGRLLPKSRVWPRINRVTAKYIRLRTNDRSLERRGAGRQVQACLFLKDKTREGFDDYGAGGSKKHPNSSIGCELKELWLNTPTGDSPCGTRTHSLQRPEAVGNDKSRPADVWGSSRTSKSGSGMNRSRQEAE